jgi:peptidyl-prolyl cis-trans isomerase D
MFEKIANRFQTFVLVALVTLLSAVFVLQFGGPQAEGCTTGGSSYAAKVDGETISPGDYRASFLLGRFDEYPPEEQRRRQLWAAVLDGLIERNLLAEAAKELGYEVTSDEVWKRFGEEATIRISLGVDSEIGSGAVRIPESYIRDEDGRFDLERTKRYIQNFLRRDVGEFAEAQILEELAERMRETVRSSVSVSEREVWEAYVREKDQARIDYAQFNPAYYRESLEPTEEDLRAWIADHEDEVQEQYEANAHRYTDLDPQVRSRHILIRPAGEGEEAEAEARAEAEELLRQLRAGADFAALAREHSQDTATAPRGGDLGYRPRGRSPAAYDEVAFELPVGTVSDVVQTPLGFHILEVLGSREGDVPEGEAKLELAEDMYREDVGVTRAREAAAEALELLRGGTSAEDLKTRLERQAQGLDPEPPVAEEGEEAEETEALAEEPVSNPLAPKLEETSLFGRGDSPIRGPFDASPLVRDVFEHDLEDPLPEEPIQLGNVFVIYQLKERQEATEEDFEEVSERIRGGLLASKQREAVATYVRELREEAQRDGRIRIRTNELEVTVEGNGEVLSDPEGIECGEDCTAAFSFGTMVQLRVRPAQDADFVGWSGACTDSSDTCLVEMTEANQVSARFRGGSAPAASSDDEESESDSE